MKLTKVESKWTQDIVRAFRQLVMDGEAHFKESFTETNIKEMRENIVGLIQLYPIVTQAMNEHFRRESEAIGAEDSLNNAFRNIGAKLNEYN